MIAKFPGEGNHFRPTVGPPSCVYQSGETLRRPGPRRGPSTQRTASPLGTRARRAGEGEVGRLSWATYRGRLTVGSAVGSSFARKPASGHGGASHASDLPCGAALEVHGRLALPHPAAHQRSAEGRPPSQRRQPGFRTQRVWWPCGGRPVSAPAASAIRGTARAVLRPPTSGPAQVSRPAHHPPCLVTAPEPPKWRAACQPLPAVAADQHSSAARVRDGRGRHGPRLQRLPLLPPRARQRLTPSPR